MKRFINFVRYEDADFAAAIAAGFAYYRENGSFIEFYFDWEDVPIDAEEIRA